MRTTFYAEGSDKPLVITKSVRTVIPGVMASAVPKDNVNHETACNTCRLSRLVHGGLEKTLRQVDYFIKSHVEHSH